MQLYNVFQSVYLLAYCFFWPVLSVNGLFYRMNECISRTTVTATWIVFTSIEHRWVSCKVNRPLSRLLFEIALISARTQTPGCSHNVIGITPEWTVGSLVSQNSQLAVPSGSDVKLFIACPVCPVICYTETGAEQHLYRRLYRATALTLIRLSEPNPHKSWKKPTQPNPWMDSAPGQFCPKCLNGLHFRS